MYAKRVNGSVKIGYVAEDGDEVIKAILSEGEVFGELALKLIGLKLMRIERKLKSLVFKNVRTRTIEFLRNTAAWKGKKVGFETMISTRLTHKDIAALSRHVKPSRVF